MSDTGRPRAGRPFDNADLLRFLAEVDIADAVHLARAAGITTKEAMFDLLEEAFPGSLLVPRVQYTAELVAADLAEDLRRDPDSLV